MFGCKNLRMNVTETNKLLNVARFVHALIHLAMWIEGNVDRRQRG